MQSKPPIPIVLVVFTAAYVVVIGVSAFRHENRELVRYLLLMAVLVSIIFIVHRRLGLSMPLLWCLSGWGLLHMAGGLLHIPAFWPYNSPESVLYSLSFVPNGLKYDQAVHAFGFGVATWLCWEVLRNGIERRYGHRLAPTFGMMLLCSAAGMGFGALNEVVEFIAVLTLPETNVGGFYNTGWDLVYNLLGALVTASVIYWRGRGWQGG